MPICNPGFYQGQVEANVEVRDILNQVSGTNNKYFTYLEVHCDTPCTMTVNDKMPFTFDSNHTMVAFPAELFRISSIKFNQTVTVTIGFGY